MPRSKGRAGRPWQRTRAAVLASCSTCAWCGQPIDLRLSGNHPAGPTVDHVIELTRGGPELDLGNLRPMHRRCNERKEIERRRRAKGPATPRPSARSSRDW